MEERMIEPKIGMTSLVWINTDSYPVGHGNYFSFNGDGPRCVNMWAENLKEIVSRLGLKEIKVQVFDKFFAFVVDDRIPKEWLNEEICLTGTMGRFPKMKLLKELLDFSGEGYGNWLCGCEDDDTSPNISRTSGKEDDGSWHTTYTCGHCERVWPPAPEGCLPVRGSKRTT